VPGFRAKSQCFDANGGEPASVVTHLSALLWLPSTR
jgi:hypothetical protein